MLARGVIGALLINIDNDFVIRHQGRVRRELEKNFHAYSPCVVDDLMANVFLKAIEKVRYFDPEKGSEEMWLRLLMKDVIYEHENNVGHTRDAMNKIIKSVDETFEDANGETTSWHELYTPEHDSLWENDGKLYLNHKDEIDYYLGLLPARLAVVFQLRMIRGNSWDEVGITMNCSGENARVICRRACQEITKLIEER